MKVIIELKSKSLKLSPDEARELFDELRAIFDPAPKLTISSGTPWIYSPNAWGGASSVFTGSNSPDSVTNTVNSTEQ